MEWHEEILVGQKLKGGHINTEQTSRLRHGQTRQQSNRRLGEGGRGQGGPRVEATLSIRVSLRQLREVAGGIARGQVGDITATVRDTVENAHLVAAAAR